MPDPVLGDDPEQRALVADAVGFALMVVLGRLEPDARLAFVLHDLFAVPFDEIATLLDRTPAAARQLASRARRAVQGAAPTPDADRSRQREVVEAFFAAARDGDLEALVAVLHPDVVFRADFGPGRLVVVEGARRVAGQAGAFGPQSPLTIEELVNGTVGAVVRDGTVLLSVTGFTVVDGLIVAIDSLADPARLAVAH